MFNIIRKAFTRRRKPTVEENLKKYLGFSEGLIAFGFFGYAIKGKLNTADCYGEDPITWDRLSEQDFWPETLCFVGTEWPSLVFAAFVVGWFFLYRTAVKHEMLILVDLYSKSNPPKDWEKMIGANVIPFLALGLTIAFFGLAWTIDNLEIFCIIMLILSIQDAFGNNMLRENIVKHFLQPQFDPDNNDALSPFILERREVALDYWVWKPQLARIGLMMIGTIVAFLAATADKVFGYNPGTYTPNLIIIAIIVANEITMDKWRTQRDRRLEDIDSRQEAAKNAAGGATAPPSQTNPG